MTRALSAFAQGCRTGMGLAGALLLAAAPLWAGDSTQQNPVVSFSTPGDKQVTLQVCNAAGCTSVTKTVTLLDPRPVVSSASFAPLAPEAGQLVFLTGAGTGKPPLAPTWKATPVGGAPLVSLPGQTLWWNTAGIPPGAYTLSFEIQNAAGTAVQELPITLAPAAPLDLYTITPCRIYDSRLGVVPVLSGVAKVIQGTGVCEIPAGARALSANVTVITPSGGGYATFYPGNYPQPIASALSFAAGTIRSNNAVLPLATDGTGTLTTLLSIAGASGNANLAIDVNGYFMPAL